MGELSLAAQLKLLKALYAFDNTTINDAGVSIVKDVDVVSAIDRDRLEERGLSPNMLVTLEHDAVVERLQRAASLLTLEQVIDLFVDGVSGKDIRSRQTLVSFLFARSIPSHAFSTLRTAGRNLIDAGPSTCQVCGLPETTVVDATGELVTYYRGHSSNEGVIGFVLELEDTLRRLPLLKPTGDRSALASIFEAIGNADEKDSPSALQTRMAKAKCFPKSEKYMRYGMLQSFAECGVLPQQLLPVLIDGFVPFSDRIEAAYKLTTSSRSDIVLPFAGWTGKTRLDTERVHAVFGT